MRKRPSRSAIVPPRKSRAKHAKWFEVPKIASWFANVSRGSEITAEVQINRLRIFCEHMEVPDPMALTKMPEDDLYELILKFVTKWEKAGYAGSSIETAVKAVKSWLNHNGISITRKIRIARVADRPTLVDERVPTQEELRRVVLSASPTTRVSIALMAFSALRPQVLGNHRGDDGLKLGDIPDLRVKGKTVAIETIPAQVIVRPELSKARHRYFTFLGREGCDYLRASLEERLHRGEKLGPETDIIAPQDRGVAADRDSVRLAQNGWKDVVRQKRMVRLPGREGRVAKEFLRKRHVTTLNISDGVKRAITRAGFDWRPYVLRAYCDTQLLLGESKGRITPAYRSFFMGHKGDIEARYTVNKSRLPKDILEDMRGAYRRCESFLSSKSEGEGGLEVDGFKAVLEGLGVSEERLAGLDFSDAEAIKQAVAEAAEKRKNAELERPAQKVVELSEIEEYLAKRWTYVAPLNGSKAIVAPPPAVGG